MTYTQAVDVQNRMVRIPNGITPMETDQVNSIIEQVEGEVNTVLAGRDVLVPVTTPAWFLNRLRSLVADGAAAIIYKSMFPEAVGPGESPAYAYFETRYRQALLQLNRMTLPGSLVMANTRLTPDTYFTVTPEADVRGGYVYDEGGSLFKAGQPL